jgi:hypothetical protein
VSTQYDVYLVVPPVGQTLMGCQDATVPGEVLFEFGGRL